MSLVPGQSSTRSHASSRFDGLHSGTNRGRFRSVEFELRSTDIQQKHGNSVYPDNYVRTAKYTVFTFIFINLFEQFSRVANLYFLFIAALQLVPQLSPTSWFTTVTPLLFVLGVNALKEVYDDYQRHKNDDEVNNREVDVLYVDRPPLRTKWRELQVGHIVKVVRDQEFPADLLFLSSSDHEALCFVETANLDGETNLKLKYCYPASESCKAADTLDLALKGKHIECENPNEKLYQFEGSIVGDGGIKESLDASNLLLRGSTLRKTDWIVGVVVFSGVDTKIRRNQTDAPRKVTQLERHMNILVLLVFGVQVIFSLVGAIGRDIWLRQHRDDYYLEGQEGWPEFGPGVPGLLVTILRFVILLNQMIPISLYVTLELVKVAQCLFFNWDMCMYHKETDTPFKCRTTTLNEDLGQVEYVLSDKTGTLTQNVMGFVWISAVGRLYGKDVDNGASLHLPREVPMDTPHSIALDPGIRKAIKNSSSRAAKENGCSLADFLVHLAVCNTVVPTTGEDGEPVYQAESPDEEALVQGARYLGYTLISRSTDVVVLNVQGRTMELKILAVLEFSSTRKRMSIICRLPDGRIRLFCKGADVVILSRLGSKRQCCKHSTQEHLEEMARSGFRTLAVAIRDLTDMEFNQWYDQFHRASVCLYNRESKVEDMANQIEQDLLLVGATAVEDKLQDGVPDAIASLRRAGIKVWVLTGDKLETAVSISYSCALFTNDMTLVTLREADFQEIGKAERALSQARQDVIHIVRHQSTSCRNSGAGLVVEGGALSAMLKPKFQQQFLRICKMCRAVVCCRVSPIQKAQVTNLVKCRVGAVVLGIGDGANDVGMIQAAHIGVGISGREGRAAVLASDFAAAQFRFLARLLLVHGRWSYKRNTEVVMYAFYKNFAYVMANVYLNFFLSGFSTQPIYNAALIATYNVFWTSLPTIAFAILEQDVCAETVLRVPELYMETIRSDWRSFFSNLARWLSHAIIHSVITFVLPIFALERPEPDGKLLGLNAAGVAIYTAVIVTVNLKVAIRTRHWTVVNAVVIWGISIGLWFPFMLVCSLLWQWWELLPDMAGVAQRLFNIPAFWLSAVVGAPAISILLDISIMSFEDQFHPADTRILQEREWLGIDSGTRTSTASVIELIQGDRSSAA